MSMALISLLTLLAAIVLGFWRKLNVGLLCMGISLLLGHAAGLSDKQIIAGFNYSLFVMLLGVTYMFSLVQDNGCLDLLAKKSWPWPVSGPFSFRS